MLELGGEKMSKSTGNLVTIADYLERHDPDSLRIMVLNGSYRAPLAYTEEVAEAADQAARRLRGALGPAAPGASGAVAGVAAELERQAAATRAVFAASMDDDFGTAGALASLFELVRAINRSRDLGATETQLRGAQGILRELAGILGLGLRESRAASAEAGGLIDLLLEVRGELRARKEWALADRIRKRLEELGIAVEDTGPDGSTWRPL